MTQETNTVETNTVETNTEVKPFYKSKIVWLAFATMFLGATEQFAVIGNLLPAEYQGAFTMVVGFLTLVARTVTGTAIVATNK